MKSPRTLAAAIILSGSMAGILCSAGLSSAQCRPDPPTGSRIGEFATVPAPPAEGLMATGVTLVSSGRFLEAAATLWSMPLLRSVPEGWTAAATQARSATLRKRAATVRAGSR